MNIRGNGLVAAILVLALILQLLSAACGGRKALAGGNDPDLQVAGWPIANEVYTTAQRQVLPVAVPASTPPVNPAQVALYGQYGYSAWQAGPPLAYVKRTELAPGYRNAPNAARLLTFFSISDIHLTDKESPAQPIFAGWSSSFGPSSANLYIGSYSPVILSTTHVLDAAIQTANALNRKTPFDFGISLGDDVNNTQYNELRWFIDVLDGKLITPSSGVHAGEGTIDYQKPYKAAGLDKSIPWYQVVGNHDQNWSGIANENVKTRQAHIGADIINIGLNDADPNFVNETGAYMGVVDGTTPLGNVIGAGLEASFLTPPTVIADADRRSLTTDESARFNWMSEFFKTTTFPVGHGFTQSNLDNDLACYTFEPKPGMPLKVIVLDDTSERNAALTGVQYVGAGFLSPARLAWLISELQKGQDENQLMIIAAHIPIKAQAGLNDTTPTNGFYDHAFEDSLLATLHSYPNLIMWISGHRHVNVVTAQPYNANNLNDHPELSFWEVETASLRDFPQQFRTFDIRRNSDNTISIITTNVDPAVAEGSPAATSRGYAVGAARIFGATPAILADTTSRSYNAELVKQLTPEMQAIIGNHGSLIK
jgi:metallophosphoesterase (TIGR03768 family)